MSSNSGGGQIVGLTEAGAARQVIVVQGDACRVALAAETGRAVVSWAGGTRGVKHADWTALASRNVVIWPDADKPGLATANEIAEILIGLGCTVRILDVMRDDPPKGWVAADAIRDGWSKSDLDNFMRSRVMAYTPPGAPIAAPVAPKIEKPADNPPAGTHSVEFRRQARYGVAPPILDPRDPMPSARELLADRFTFSDLPTMHHYRGTFWRWNGACYRDADNDSVQAQIWRYLDGAKRYGKEGETFDFQPNKGEVENVAAAFRAVCNLPGHLEAPTWLSDSQPLPPRELLPVRNGLLHLPSARLTEPTPAFFCTNASDVAFDIRAPEPREWLDFLHQIWPDDQQSIDTLQEVFGYLLCPDTSHQKIPLIVGPKRSGKGTIARILNALLGQDSVCAPTLASLATNFGLSPLIGKSVAIIGDARLSGKADQAAIAERLLSISGEDSITVDRKFQSAWTGRLGVRFVIMSNELPRLSDASGALASRFIVLTMERSFYGHEDRGLGNRLMGDLPGILNWAREGYLRLRGRGYFQQPDSARDAIEDLEELGSPISAFVKAKCVVAPGRRASANELFDAWRDWCAANGRREPGTTQSFGRDLRSSVSGLRVAKPRVDGNQIRHYEGIALKNDDERVTRAAEDW